jgi:HNH endonuclease
MVLCVPKRSWSKTSNKDLKRKCIDLAKKICRYEGVCKKCGRTREAGWQIHAAHIIPVTYANTCADTYNLIPLCAACHSMGANSMHDNPIHFAEWFNSQYPERYKLLWAIARSVRKNDWEMVLIKLKAEFKLKQYGNP